MKTASNMLTMWRSHIGKLTGHSIDTNLDKLWIALKVEDSKDDNSEYSDSTEEEKNE